MVTPLRIGIAGLGNVGAGVVKILTANAELVAKRAGRPIVVTAVSARDRSRDRGVSLDGIAWVDDAAELATRDDVDVVVELIGGSDGPALTLARRTLGAGKPLVTANKAMLAHHGLELAEAAEKAGLPLKYEAAVAGGIPVIKGLAEGAAANRITRVYGLMNGTCNYILSRMEAEGLGFGEVLADAQALGFAEADPSFDIDGIDTAHKLSILAALAFGARIDFAGVACHGIRNVAAADIAQAAALGFRIKLVGLAEAENGELFQRVHPALVPIDHPKAPPGGSVSPDRPAWLADPVRSSIPLEVLVRRLEKEEPERPILVAGLTSALYGVRHLSGAVVVWLPVAPLWWHNPGYRRRPLEFLHHWLRARRMRLLTDQPVG